MCGRFTLAGSPDVYAQHFSVDFIKTEALARNYNVAPTDPVYAIAEHDGERQLGRVGWGLIPWWAKDKRTASRHINARAETVATKPAFKDSFARRRCLIPADGFYEWEPIPDRGKLPHYIYSADGTPLAFAGLWAGWSDPETSERLKTCTIVTGRPNELVGRLHDRMPVILPEDSWEAWLDPDNGDTDQLLDLLRRPPVVSLAEHAVSTLVNDVRNNLPECVAPLHPDEREGPRAEEA